MKKINIKTKFKWSEDLSNAVINVKPLDRLVEIKIENRLIMIPFESIDYIDIIN